MLQIFVFVGTNLCTQIKNSIPVKLLFLASFNFWIQSNFLGSEELPDEKTSLFKKIQDGPISFEVTVQSSVDYLKNYYGSKGLCFAQYIVNPRPESAFIPSIGIGLNNLGEDVLISESNSPNITIIIQTNSEDENLYKWASEKQKNWNESPTGVLYSSNFLTTKNGFNGVSIVREINEQKDFYISVDLTTKEWSEKNYNLTGKKDNWLQIQIISFNDTSNESVLSNAIKIADSINYNHEKKQILPIFEEIQSEKQQIKANSKVTITDSAISYLIPKDLKIEYKKLYFENGNYTIAQHNFENPKEDLSATLIVHKEKKYPDLETWARHQISTWTNSPSGILVGAEKFRTKWGNNGILVLRQTGGTLDFNISLDLTNPEWKKRNLNSSGGIDDRWLRLQIVGFYDPVFEGIFPTVLEIAKSINLEKSFEPVISNNEILQELEFQNFKFDSKRYIHKGLSFSVPQEFGVDYIKFHDQRSITSEGIINLSKEFSNSFITIKVFTENIFPDLSTWGIYAKSAAAKSSSTTNVSAKTFTTKNGLNGIFIKRNSIDGRDYHASVDLSTESWKKNLQLNSSYSENLWLRGEISSTKNSNNNSFFETALAIADSIIYEKSDDIRVETFSEISPYTLFRSPEISPSWYHSHWFGSFFQSNEGWIYHELMGWLFPNQISLSSAWVWHEALDWLWVSENSFPYFYSAEYHNWLYFDEKFLSREIFFNFNAKEWQKTNLLQKILKDNSGDELKTIIKIMESSLSENEKLNGVGRVILFGN